jgi:D-methionine transport system ATP-binding protein
MTNETLYRPDVPLIELQDVSKTYLLQGGQRFDAVRPLSLRIHRGEVFGLVGQSGAGKSTLLRLINLLERPDGGSVRVAGQDLLALGRRELRQARQNIGMIFQQFNLLQNATVYDNVAFPLRVHGHRSRHEINTRVQECLALVGLQDKRDSYPARLSGGQKQRVAIARALGPRPDVLLCDEPTSALDPETTRSLLQTLKDINTQLGVTIVIVTHELPVVHALCSHVAVLEKGDLIEQFALAEVLQPRASALGRELADGVRERQWRAERTATSSQGNEPAPQPSPISPNAADAATPAPTLIERVAYA